jgi:hypothetical protein
MNETPASGSHFPGVLCMLGGTGSYRVF